MINKSKKVKEDAIRNLNNWKGTAERQIMHMLILLAEAIEEEINHKTKTTESTNDIMTVEQALAIAEEMRGTTSEEEALLVLTSHIRKLEKQLPDGMKDCTIVFKQCERGHSWLSASNWAQHSCPTCLINSLNTRVNALAVNKYSLEEQLARESKALNEFLEKTNWLMDSVEPADIGLHRADVLRKRINNLKDEVHKLSKDNGNLRSEKFEMGARIDALVVIKETLEARLASVQAQLDKVLGIEKREFDKDV